jgi:hypothetical protein
MPSGLLVDIILKDQVNATLFSYVQEENGNNEIFAYQDEWDPQFINISNSENDDLHPYLVLGYVGFSLIHYHIYNIWESYRNDHWQLYLSENEIISGENEVDISSDSDIHIFPNPISDHTAISFTLQKSSYVKLEVLNGLGRVVATIVDEKLTPGTHHITWNTDGLPAGIYFCRFQAGDNVRTEKMIIMQ